MTAFIFYIGSTVGWRHPHLHIQIKENCPPYYINLFFLSSLVLHFWNSMGEKKTVLTIQNESHTNLKSLGLALKTNPTKKSKKKWPPISCQGERVRTNIAQDLDGAETPLANNWHCLQQKIKANQSVFIFVWKVHHLEVSIISTRFLF